MNIKEELEKHIAQSKRYVKLQDEGATSLEAAYKVFGNEVGDALVLLKQSEIQIKINNHN